MIQVLKGNLGTVCEPTNEELLNVSQANILTWVPTFQNIPHQSQASKIEQQSALQLCLQAINKYSSYNNNRSSRNW